MRRHFSIQRSLTMTRASEFYCILLRLVFTMVREYLGNILLSAMYSNLHIDYAIFELAMESL